MHLNFIVFGLAVLPRLLELGRCFYFLTENAWFGRRYLDMKVVRHGVFSFVTVETRTMCSCFFRVSLKICKDFGTHPELRVILGDIILSFVDLTAL